VLGRGGWCCQVLGRLGRVFGRGGLVGSVSGDRWAVFLLKVVWKPTYWREVSSFAEAVGLTVEIGAVRRYEDEKEDGCRGC
jgi:hypothetical protein